MGEQEIMVIVALLYASPAILVALGLLTFLRWLIVRNREDRQRQSGIGGMLLFSACLLSAVWCLRYAVGYYASISAADGVQTLTKLEEVFNSVVHALQTFSMDEDYTEYILNGKRMLAEIFGSDSCWQTVYGIYASVLNFIAPIAGGAIIFEILASIFPRLRLFFLYLLVRREKCYFSALTPASLALAQSLREQKRGKAEKPVLIFTDTYVDDEKEKDYELLLSAKQLGAICVRDDLLHVAKNLFGKRSYYLMDENELENLQTLQSLAEKTKREHLKKSNIYLFVQSDLYVRMEKQIRERLKERICRGDAKKEDMLPVIVPVHSYRNLVHNLLTEVPLYEPLVHKANKKVLNVTILGNGIIGTEAFFGTYWFGQLLISESDSRMSPCSLKINVVSKDTEADFWAKIAYTNPEIKKTTDTGGDILLYNSHDRNAPYCQVNYRNADVKSGGFMDMEAEDSKFLLETDYFIVALGNDADNITVAERLRCSIGKKHLEQKHADGPKTTVSHTVIAYAVFNSAVCKTMNERRFYSSCQSGVTDIYLHAFGSLEQVYSSDNMLMSKSLLWAEEIGHAYLKPQLDERYLQDNKKRANDEDKDYNYWADLARAMHVKYKVFSLGWITTSVFDAQDETSCREKHCEQVQKACAQYKRIAITKDPRDYCPADDARREELERKKHALAWLEHRRWCAFTRTMGYQWCDALEENLALYGKHKNMPLKLHPCLVEAQMPAPLENAGKVSYLLRRDAEAKTLAEEIAFLKRNEADRDCLDDVTYRWFMQLQTYKKKTGKELYYYDFKKYDYFTGEFDDYCTVQQTADRLKCETQWVEWLCGKGRLAGAVKFDEQGIWLVPKRAVDEKLEKWYYKLRPAKKAAKKEMAKQA